MNEVKKSLDAVAGDMTKDKEELKQRVLSGRRKPKRRNPFPLVATAIVAAAVLFFTFNVFQDGLSTGDKDKDKDEYEVNEFIYESSLTSGEERDFNTDRLRQKVLQGILQIDALIDYAKSVGYIEDTVAIEEKVAEHKQRYFEESGKENDDYFNIIFKWSLQYEEVLNWLVQHPQDDIKTHNEVINLFQKKHKQSIANFMDRKGIPSFDPSSKYEEVAGTVLAKEGQQILVAYRVEIMSIPELTTDEMIDAGHAAWYMINENVDGIEPNMKIRLTYDSLSYPITETDPATVYQEVIEWSLIDAIVQPTFSEEQGLFYLHGLTLGDTQSDVIERFGEKHTKYTEGQVDGSGADFALDYNNNATFYFYQDKISSISFENVDQNYFEQHYEEYNGIKFTSDDDRFIYSKETAQIIKAAFIPDGSLTISLFLAWPDDLLENKEYLEAINK